MTDAPAAERRPQRTARRRDELLETALRLFNAHGTAAVSANHIAAATGISPGNLYYWFPNKQAIIRALFAEWATASTAPEALPTDAPHALRTFIDALAAQSLVTARFAFFSRELTGLLTADPELAAAYRANFTAKVDAITALIEQLVAAGLLHEPAPGTDPREIVVAAWIASEATPAFLEVVDPEASALTAPAVSTALVRALLTEEGARALHPPAD